MSSIEQYIPIVGKSTVDELFLLGERLQGKSLQNINSTAVGGGVAEILSRMVPLLKDLGVQVRWDVIRGDDRFFTVTKKMHNALHGVAESFRAEDFDGFVETNRRNAAEIELVGDTFFIHDPQPIALVEKKAEIGGKWVWRCHIDFTNPRKRVWDFLKFYVERYEAAVFSAPAFSRSLSIRQVLISPSIDPLSDKNRDLPEAVQKEVCARFGIDPSRPIVTQISRFDYLKDPVGVIRAYKMAKKYVDCQLVLAGGGATDDPEGARVLEEVRSEAADDPDIFVLFLPPASDLEINALQRVSTVILQKSLREGFGLTVSEALWKSKPVIASAVGGIPLQIAHKFSGILTHSIEGTAYRIKQLLQEPDYARKLGENGHEHILNNFLITRHIRDYMLLWLSLYSDQDVIHL